MSEHEPANLPPDAAEVSPAPLIVPPAPELPTPTPREIAVADTKQKIIDRAVTMRLMRDNRDPSSASMSERQAISESLDDIEMDNATSAVNLHENLETMRQKQQERYEKGAGNKIKNLAEKPLVRNVLSATRDLGIAGVARGLVGVLAHGARAAGVHVEPVVESAIGGGLAATVVGQATAGRTRKESYIQQNLSPEKLNEAFNTQALINQEIAVDGSGQERVMRRIDPYTAESAAGQLAVYRQIEESQMRRLPRAERRDFYNQVAHLEHIVQMFNIQTIMERNTFYSEAERCDLQAELLLDFTAQARRTNSERFRNDMTGPYLRAIDALDTHKREMAKGPSAKERLADEVATGLFGFATAGAGVLVELPTPVALLRDSAIAAATGSFLAKRMSRIREKIKSPGFQRWIPRKREDETKPAEIPREPDTGERTISARRLTPQMDPSTGELYFIRTLVQNKETPPDERHRLKQAIDKIPFGEKKKEVKPPEKETIGMEVRMGRQPGETEELWRILSARDWEALARFNAAYETVLTVTNHDTGEKDLKLAYVGFKPREGAAPYDPNEPGLAPKPVPESATLISNATLELKRLKEDEKNSIDLEYEEWEKEQKAKKDQRPDDETQKTTRKGKSGGKETKERPIAHYRDVVTYNGEYALFDNAYKRDEENRDIVLERYADEYGTYSRLRNVLALPPTDKGRVAFMREHVVFVAPNPNKETEKLIKYVLYVRPRGSQDLAPKAAEQVAQAETREFVQEAIGREARVRSLGEHLEAVRDLSEARSSRPNSRRQPNEGDEQEESPRGGKPQLAQLEKAARDPYYRRPLNAREMTYSSRGGRGLLLDQGIRAEVVTDYGLPSDIHDAMTGALTGKSLDVRRDRQTATEQSKAMGDIIKESESFIARALSPDQRLAFRAENLPRFLILGIFANTEPNRNSMQNARQLVHLPDSLYNQAVRVFTDPDLFTRQLALDDLKSRTQAEINRALASKPTGTEDFNEHDVRIPARALQVSSSQEKLLYLNSELRPSQSPGQEEAYRRVVATLNQGNFAALRGYNLHITYEGSMEDGHYAVEIERA